MQRNAMVTLLSYRYPLKQFLRLRGKRLFRLKDYLAGLKRGLFEEESPGRKLGSFIDFFCETEVS